MVAGRAGCHSERSEGSRRTDRPRSFAPPVLSEAEGLRMTRAALRATSSPMVGCRAARDRHPCRQGPRDRGRALGAPPAQRRPRVPARRGRSGRRQRRRDAVRQARRAIRAAVGVRRPGRPVAARAQLRRRGRRPRPAHRDAAGAPDRNRERAAGAVRADPARAGLAARLRAHVRRDRGAHAHARPHGRDPGRRPRAGAGRSRRRRADRRGRASRRGVRQPALGAVGRPGRRRDDPGAGVAPHARRGRRDGAHRRPHAYPARRDSPAEAERAEHARGADLHCPGRRRVARGCCASCSRLP
jgi:hypothetical protein